MFNENHIYHTSIDEEMLTDVADDLDLLKRVLTDAETSLYSRKEGSNVSMEVFCRTKIEKGLWSSVKRESSSKII